ncbi:MAG TPA: hypothetical protein VJ798_11480, partial [Rhizomicrobium sp.]|nr:hypothetical protein [Rhizomicrobium sp.]
MAYNLQWITAFPVAFPPREPANIGRLFLRERLSGYRVEEMGRAGTTLLRGIFHHGEQPEY